MVRPKKAVIIDSVVYDCVDTAAKSINYDRSTLYAILRGERKSGPRKMEIAWAPITELE